MDSKINKKAFSTAHFRPRDAVSYVLYMCQRDASALSAVERRDTLLEIDASALSAQPCVHLSVAGQRPHEAMT
jgi:hypothetical protein